MAQLAFYKCRHCAVLIVAGVLMLSSASGAGFRVTGKLSQWEPKATAPVWTSTFDVSVLGDQWVQTTHLGEGKDMILGCDGENVYCLFADAASKSMGKIKTFPGNVFKGRYPVQSPFISTTLPWIAYSSGAYFESGDKNEVANLPVPWLSAWAQPLAHIYQSTCRQIPGGAGLPERLEFVPSEERMNAVRQGSFKTIAGVSKSEHDRAVLRLSYYNRIMEPEAVYEVTRTTNFNGRVLPTEFSLTKYVFEALKESDALQKSVQGTTKGSIEALETILNIDPFPKSFGGPGDISVADYRFRDAKKGLGFLTYQATNSKWLAESDPYLQQRYLGKLKGAKLHLSTPKVGGAIALVSFLTVIALPFAFKGFRDRAQTFIKGLS